MLNGRYWGITGLLLAATIGFASGASMAGDRMAGAELAKRWCASCHATGNSTTARDVGPSFVEIANDPNRTDGWLRSWLVSPHPPMPNPGLTRIEIENLIVYLTDLRTK
jgi:mono/diheme cytochrome c family protein